MKHLLRRPAGIGMRSVRYSTRRLSRQEAKFRKDAKNLATYDFNFAPLREIINRAEF